MNSVSPAAVSNASSANLDSVQGQAAMSMLKKSLNMQANSAAQLIQALPQPALATSGGVGTQVNTYA
jgi:Putative motility protein